MSKIHTEQVDHCFAFAMRGVQSCSLLMRMVKLSRRPNQDGFDDLLQQIRALL